MKQTDAVVSIFVDNPYTWFSAKDVRNIMGVSSNSINSLIAKLFRIGVLVAERDESGRLYYRYNR